MAMVRNGDVADWRLADEKFLASFRLPTAADKCEALAIRNPFPREHRIAFHEQEHIYTVDGTKVPRSVTKLVHEYTTAFDPFEAIDAMQMGARWDEKRHFYTNKAGE